MTFKLVTCCNKDSLFIQFIPPVDSSFAAEMLSQIGSYSFLAVVQLQRMISGSVVFGNF